MELRFDAFGQFFDRFGLGQAGRALDQHGRRRAGR
jgi:hypothetical protein